MTCTANISVSLLTITFILNFFYHSLENITCLYVEKGKKVSCKFHVHIYHRFTHIVHQNNYDTQCRLIKFLQESVQYGTFLQNLNIMYESWENINYFRHLLKQEFESYWFSLLELWFQLGIKTFGFSCLFQFSEPLQVHHCQIWQIKNL